MRYFTYVIFLILGLIIGKYYNVVENQDATIDQVVVFTNGIKNMSKLVVTQGSLSEVYTFKDTKNYFSDVLSFEKKAILSTNARVEIGYNLKDLKITIDSINKQIIIDDIPIEKVTIIPNISYVYLDESNFNEFTEEEHNKLRGKVINKIKESITYTNLKKTAKIRLIEELKTIYQLSKVYHWKIIDNTIDQDLSKRLILWNRQTLKN